MIFVRFNKAVGEIPQGALGILRMNIMAGDIDRNRVFIPRRYVGLSEDVFPCYEMPTVNDGWVEVPETSLTKKELQELIDLDKEISDKTHFLVGPDGVTITIVGNASPSMFNNVNDEGEEWKNP